MKKLIFGCSLMICGMIGAVGWLIASMLLVDRGAWSSVSNVFSDIYGLIIIFFFLLVIIGAVIGLKALKEKRA